ncbi:arginine--tRNA ligase [Rhodovulum sp. DZ06]|uniref:arginine--tRNA ligase n=1 Tax=Rhodovulum sp. DZ06 TaxID=3425126 RepID=UPI003D32799B
MNLFADIRTLVTDSLDALAAEGALPAGMDFGPVAVEPPRDPAHGDMATNAAMALARQAKMKPRDVAELLAPRLTADPRVEEASVAGPGFINLRLSTSVWTGAVSEALAKGADFGRSSVGAGRKVNVEYVSANPTGPLHVGHARGAIFGDALAGLLDFAGWDVTREYYINDGGAQVDVLARSAFQRYLEVCGQEFVVQEGLYPGEYLIPVGQKLHALWGDSKVDAPEEEWLAEAREIATEMMMEMIREDLAALGVTMDRFFSEKALYGTGLIESAIESLREKGLIYRGTLEPPKGKTPEDWEPREQTLFKSTEYGDDVDRPIQKSDGGWTYFAPDIAYHFDKVERGYDLLIDVFGADHGGYVKRMKAAVAALSDRKTPLEIKLCQLVKLYKNGEPYKMSKRAGTFVTLRDVVDEVGADVARFTMLTRKNDAPLDFDFAKALEQSKDNPVFYVQYAHARAKSVLRMAETKGVDASGVAGADLSLLSHPAHVELMRKLGEWPRLVEIAAQHQEPHRVAFFLQELAADFHGHWNKGKDTPELRFVQEDDAAVTLANLALVEAVAVVISAGLGILGVTPLNEMR